MTAVPFASVMSLSETTRRKPGPKPGPRKLTKARTEAVCRNLRKGADKETAFRLAGIWPSTGFRWLAYGRAGEGEEFRRFSEAVEKAEAEADIEDIEFIRKDDSWQSKAWRLERRRPDRWGRKDKLDVSLSVDEYKAEVAQLVELALRFSPTKRQAEFLEAVAA